MWSMPAGAAGGAGHRRGRAGRRLRDARSRRDLGGQAGFQAAPADQVGVAAAPPVRLQPHLCAAASYTSRLRARACTACMGWRGALAAIHVHACPGGTRGPGGRGPARARVMAQAQAWHAHSPLQRATCWQPRRWRRRAQSGWGPPQGGLRAPAASQPTRSSARPLPCTSSRCSLSSSSPLYTL